MVKGFAQEYPVGLRQCGRPAQAEGLQAGVPGAED